LKVELEWARVRELDGRELSLPNWTPIAEDGSAGGAELHVDQGLDAQLSGCRRVEIGASRYVKAPNVSEPVTDQ
jgi:hypothetical protein